MKYLLGILLMSSAHATILSQYHSSPSGSSVQTFDIGKSKTTFEKASNFFDKEKSYRLGTFTTSKDQFKKEDLKKLEDILAKIKEVDTFLKQKDSSFNDLADKSPHKSFLMLDQYRISQGSDLYPEVKKLFDHFQKLNWKQESGIKLSDDLKTLTTIKDSKEVKSEKFDFAFHCKDQAAPTVCAYKDVGILFLE